MSTRFAPPHIQHQYRDWADYQSESIVSDESCGGIYQASPPIKYPDYYGVDTPDQNELLASKFDIEGMRRFINATTLQFLSIEGLYKSMGHEKRNSSYPQFTDHCFTV